MKRWPPIAYPGPGDTHRNFDQGTGARGSWLDAAGYQQLMDEVAGATAKGGFAASGAQSDQLYRLIRRGANYAGVAGGTANAPELAFDPAPLAGEIAVGFEIRFKVAAPNTDAMTLKLNEVVADLVDYRGNPLGTNATIVGAIMRATWDGAKWRLSPGVTSEVRSIVTTVLNDFVVIADQKANGVNGGDFLAGAWRTRDLNTMVADPNGLVAAGAVTLAANRVTLGIGAWLIEASAPACAVNSHKTRLQNISDGTTAIWGSTEQTTQNTNTDQIATRSIVLGRVNLAASKQFELQHVCEQSSTGFASGVGFGIGSVYLGGGVPEIYSTLTARRIG